MRGAGSSPRQRRTLRHLPQSLRSSMIRTSIGAVCALLLLGACSDAAGPTGDRMTRQEALLVSGDVTARGEQTTTTAAPSSSTGALAISADPTTVTHDLE